MKKLFKCLAIILLLSLTILSLFACTNEPHGEDPLDGHVCDENCTLTATEWFDNYKHYPKTLLCDSGKTVRRSKIEIATANDFILLASDLKASNFVGITEFIFTNDIDMAGKVWEPIDFRITKSSSYYDTVLDFDGNGKTIKNLTMLEDYSYNAGIFGEVNGAVGFTFKNLTLDGAKIYGDVEDSMGSTSGSEKGIGAFIGAPRGIEKDIIISGCTLKNSEIKGAHWAGGFLGYVSKEKMTTTLDTGKVLVSITDSTVENSSIISKGSAGGIVGHAGGCRNIKMTANSVTVKNSTITCLGSSKIKAGSFVGTVGLAQITITNSTFTENTVVSGGQENTIRKYYGRFGGASDVEFGRLSVNGQTIDPHEN